MLIIKYGTTKIELLYVACFSFLFHKLLKYYHQFINNLDCKSKRSCYPSKMQVKSAYKHSYKNNGQCPLYRILKPFTVLQKFVQFFQRDEKTHI